MYMSVRPHVHALIALFLKYPQVKYSYIPSILTLVHFFNNILNLQVLIIGGSTGTMLEALDVVGDDYDGSLGTLGEVCLSLHSFFFSSFTLLVIYIM